MVNVGSFATPEEALRRLQDWPFTQGFAVVTESTTSASTTGRRQKNSCKTATEDRERVALDCVGLFELCKKGLTKLVEGERQQREVAIVV
jgi:hypothetical protein